MNSIIESLNLWGERFLSFTWPLLWQSSLLIIVLLGLDFALRRRVRAAVRYALWLVVLVKLMLPPSLALPTGLAWWLQPRHAPPVKPQPTFVVTYGSSIATELPPVVETTYTPPPPRLSRDGWALAAWAVVGAALLGWMGVRWRQIARDIHRAEPAPPWLDELLTAAREQAGLRRRVELRLTARPMSPAVCGLIRPVILLPRRLVEQLPRVQLRAVLLHELVHLRRGDVWVNCAQALLQIAYWWHPLLWLANARIRRAREEAVDDAVMLALRDDAESYAPTLLEVAKLAFYRPLASLGLVGILESRNALRQRIERLVSFRPPRKAGLTIASALCVLVFAAVAVPMEKAPAVSDEPASTRNGEGVPSNQPTASAHNPGTEAVKLEQKGRLLPQVVGLDQTEANLRRAIALDPENILASYYLDEITKLRQGKGDPLVTIYPTLESDTALRFRDKVPVLGDLPLFGRFFRSESSGSGWPATDHDRADSGITTMIEPLSGLPLWTNAPLRTRVFNVDPNTFNAAVCKRVGLSETNDMAQFSTAFRKLLADIGVDLQPPKTLFYGDRKGKLLVRATHEDLDRIDSLLKDLVGVPPQITEVAPATHKTNVFISSGRKAILDKLNSIRLQNVHYDSLPLSEVLRNLYDDVKKRDPEKRGITFLLNPNIPPPAGASIDLTTGLPVQAAPTGDAVDVGAIAIKLNPGLSDVSLGELLEAIVKVAEKPIKFSVEEYAIVFSSRWADQQALTTRTFNVDPNTFNAAVRKRVGLSDTNDMAQFSAALRKLIADIGVDLQPPKTLFYGDRKGKLLVRATSSDMDLIQSLLEELNYTPPLITLASKFIEMPEQDYVDLWAKWTPVSHSASGGWAVVLTSAQARELVDGLKAKPNVDIVTGPSVTTLSGRQAQIQIVDLKTIVTGLTSMVTNGVTNSTYQTQQMAFGPVLDVLPTISADGYTIQITSIPTLTEFLGYDDPRTFVPNYAPGRSNDVVLPLPHFRVRQTTTSIAVWDGQTVVIGNVLPVEILIRSDGKEDHVLSTDKNLKRLIVLLTPTIIDPAGNRIHSEEEMPFAREGVPPQPSR